MASIEPVFISENDLKSYTNWQEIKFVLEQAFLSVSNTTKLSNHPHSSQPKRSFVSTGEGVLLCMPGFMGNHNVFKNSLDSTRRSTLACKLITSFSGNPGRNSPLPDINGNIFLFDENTGKLQATLEANYLTGLRTAAASIVATEQVFFPRIQDKSKLILGIIGCGTQGEFHAIGFMNTHKFHQIKLWNRTRTRAELLKTKLIEMAAISVSPEVEISVHDSVSDCCKECDVLVTATSSNESLVFKTYLKPNSHINAIGARAIHHIEIDQDVYDDCQVFIDYWDGVRAELVNLKANIVGEIGEVMLHQKNIPISGITVFQSLGMAVEDVAIGQLFYTKYRQNNAKQQCA
ncbi:ketimine reductase mu-crystallin [Malaya genurostris]|uniref:ketimine reductase mu-crystallin n=1 Tax=Malaya genurostris TaxID=325434 RepID=UPI0026F3B9A4|nr:ketimine reductase mu-crystallin [Malaya genurostris]